MFRHIALALTLAVALVSASACAVFHPGPDSPDALVLYAGDAGVACAAIPVAAPQDLDKARLAVGCARALFSVDSIDAKDIVACASAAGVPEAYKSVLAAVADRVVVRAGGPIFPKDSVAGEAIKAFLSTCGAALGVN